MAELNARYVGRRGYLTVLNYKEIIVGNDIKQPASPGVQVPVRVLDVRFVYGLPRLLIQPIGGQGSAWVSARKVRVTEELA